MLIRDLIWVWGNPEMAEEGEHALATFAEAGPAQRARLLGVRNIVMAGPGVPSDDHLADTWAREIAGSPRVVWEVGPDGGEIQPPFVFENKLAQIRRLADRHPQIEGILLDDMSTLGIERGFKPEHIRDMRDLLSGKYSSVKIWGVLYTMSLNIENIADYVQYLDVVNLWAWDAKDVVDFESHVAHCEQKLPKKPIILGLYLYDYGGQQRIAPDLLRHQCDTALRLAHARRIQGIVFLTTVNDPEAVGWAADWIEQVGGQKLNGASE